MTKTILLVVGTLAVFFACMPASASSSKGSHPQAQYSVAPNDVCVPCICANCYSQCVDEYDAKMASCLPISFMIDDDGLGLFEGMAGACRDQAEANYNSCKTDCEWIPGCA